MKKIKKKKVWIVVFLIFLIGVNSSVLAITLSLSKENYYPRESLRAEIEGAFLGLELKNIHIYSEESLRPLPLISELIKWKNKYYFYAILPNYEGNFSLKIENAKYLKGGKIIDTPIVKNFTIIKSNKTYLSIKPGFVLVKSGDEGVVKITSIGGNKEVNIESGISNLTTSKKLIEEIEEVFRFSTENFSGKSYLKIDSYEIPIFVIGASTSSNDSKINNKSGFDISSINLKFFSSNVSLKENKYDVFFILENKGSKNLSKIKLLSDKGDVNPKEIDLPSNSSTLINLTLKDIEEKSISGFIFLEINKTTYPFPFSIDISRVGGEKVNVSGTGSSGYEVQQYSCESLGGVICKENEKCKGEVVSSLEGNCCKGECSKEEGSSSLKKIIAIILILIIGGVVFYLYKRSKKVEKPKSVEDILKEKRIKQQDIPRSMPRKRF